MTDTLSVHLRVSTGGCDCCGDENGVDEGVGGPAAVAAAATAAAAGGDNVDSEGDRITMVLFTEVVMVGQPLQARSRKTYY